MIFVCVLFIFVRKNGGYCWNIDKELCQNLKNVKSSKMFKKKKSTVLYFLNQSLYYLFWLWIEYCTSILILIYHTHVCKKEIEHYTNDKMECQWGYQGFKNIYLFCISVTEYSLYIICV